MEDDAIADARRWGFGEEAIAVIGAALAGPPGVGVWPQNMESVTAFLAVSTQWRTAPLASGRVMFVGLDYASAQVALDARGFAVTPELWVALQVMEDEALAVLNSES